jgi:hypothetical protein
MRDGGIRRLRDGERKMDNFLTLCAMPWGLGSRKQCSTKHQESQARMTGKVTFLKKGGWMYGMAEVFDEFRWKDSVGFNFS